MAQHPFGVKFQYDLDGSPPFTDIATIESVGGVDMSVGSSMVTHLESVNAFAEKIPGWCDAGKVPVVIYATKAQLNTLRTTLWRTTYYWRIVWPLLTGESTGSLWHFQGHITKLHETDKSAKSDDAIRIELEIDITGSPTFTQGA